MVRDNGNVNVKNKEKEEITQRESVAVARAPQGTCTHRTTPPFPLPIFVHFLTYYPRLAPHLSLPHPSISFPLARARRPPARLSR